jgi:hypothetical protein
MAIDTHREGEKRLREKLTLFLSERHTSRLPAAAQGPRLEVQHILGRIERAGARAFFFGGLLRHLLLRPIYEQPRDVDLVIDCKSNDELARLLSDLPTKVNRFGGVRVLTTIPIDIWALRETWAFKSGFCPVSAENLPRTTFFNVEAVVASLDLGSHHRRDVYSAGFFQGLDSKTLEVNLAANPFPALCIARAMVLATTLDFWIGRTLAEYIVRETSMLSSEELEQIQRTHYGDVRLSAKSVRMLASDIADQIESGYERIALAGSAKSQRKISLAGDWSERSPYRGLP